MQVDSILKFGDFEAAYSSYVYGILISIFLGLLFATLCFIEQPREKTYRVKTKITRQRTLFALSILAISIVGGAWLSKKSNLDGFFSIEMHQSTWLLRNGEEELIGAVQPDNVTDIRLGLTSGKTLYTVVFYTRLGQRFESANMDVQTAKARIAELSKSRAQ